MAFKAKFPQANYSVTTPEVAMTLVEYEENHLHGGHKAAMTPNGDAFVILRDNGTVYLRKRTATGAKSTIASWVSPGSGAIDTDGTYLYLVVTFATTAKFYKLDQAGNILIQTDVCPGQNSMDLTCDIKISATGKLCMTFGIKNATRPNSFNVGVSISINGGTTWSAWENLTTHTSAYMYSGYATIVFKADGNPYIVYQYSYSNTPTYTLYSRSHNGSAWGAAVVIMTSSTESYEYPKLTKTPDNRIHLVHCTGGNGYVEYRYSTDHGVTWSSAVRIDPSYAFQYAPDLTYDADGNLYILWIALKNGYNIGERDVRIIKFNGSWGAITDITNSKTSRQYAHFCRGFTNFTSAPPLVFNLSYTSLMFWGTWFTGGWVPTKVWVKVAGTWRLGTVYARMGGVWKAV